MKFLKFIKNLILFFLLILLVLPFVHNPILGKALDPYLEGVLARVFNMPVNIEGLSVRPFPGHVRAKRIEFLNPDGFKNKYHFLAEGFSGGIDFFALKKRFVDIGVGNFEKVTYIIEKKQIDKKIISNLGHWLTNIKERNAKKRERRIALNIPTKPPWRVKIRKVEIKEGIFVYNYHSTTENYEILSPKFRGYWSGFDRPFFIKEGEDFPGSEKWTEDIYLKGLLGEKTKAHFLISGKTQFSAGANFYLDCKITGGALTDYPFIWKGLPGKIKGGTFDLVSKFNCIKGSLDVKNKLSLKSLEINKSTATEKIFGLPVDVFLGILKDNKQIDLSIHIKGNVRDPKFEFFRSFSSALQKALFHKIKYGFGTVGKGAAKVVGGVGDQIMSGLEKITETLNNGFKG